MGFAVDLQHSLEDLIARLSEFVDDPDRLEARAAALRAAGEATEAAEAKWGIDGAAFMAGDADALAPLDFNMYAVSHVAGLERGLDQLTELVEHLGDFIHLPGNLCPPCDARLHSHLQAAFEGMRDVDGVLTASVFPQDKLMYAEVRRLIWLGFG